MFKIEAEHLSKFYGQVAALRDVTFGVAEGEILGFLGPNGAGKTTTMRILAGYIPATTGTARIDGYEVHDRPMQARQRLGYLPENPPLYPDMSVEGFLHFVARIKGVSAGERPLRVKAALRRCNLSEKAKDPIRKLSKGYRQRVGIAQAIVHDPPAIILDEPTVGLDPRQITEVRRLIKSLAGRHTLILSTHILPEVSMTCNRVAIITSGQVVATGTPENLQSQLISGSSYELEVGGEPLGLRSQLLEIPGVSEVSSMAQPDGQGDRLRIRCANGSEPGAHIARLVLDAGLNLREMRRLRPTLEDVFLELTARETLSEENGADLAVEKDSRS